MQTVSWRDVATRELIKLRALCLPRRGDKRRLRTMLFRAGDSLALKVPQANPRRLLLVAMGEKGVWEEKIEAWRVKVNSDQDGAIVELASLADPEWSVHATVRWSDSKLHTAASPQVVAFQKGKIASRGTPDPREARFGNLGFA